jgi:hypothetical protein
MSAYSFFIVVKYVDPSRLYASQHICILAEEDWTHGNRDDDIIPRGITSKLEADFHLFF